MPIFESLSCAQCQSFKKRKPSYSSLLRSVISPSEPSHVDPRKHRKRRKSKRSWRSCKGGQGTPGSARVRHRRGGGAAEAARMQLAPDCGQARLEPAVLPKRELKTLDVLIHDKAKLITYLQICTLLFYCRMDN